MADPCRIQQGLDHSTIPRSVRDADLDFSRMDDINYLRYRNIQLETELRFLKEQLAQAYSGTQYMIGCFTKAHELNSTTSVDRGVTKVHRLRDDHAHSRRRLSITRNEAEYAYESDQLSKSQSQLNDFQIDLHHYHSVGRHTEASSTPTLKAQDLLKFEDAVLSPTTADLQSPATSFESDANTRPLTGGTSFNTSFTSATSFGSDVPRFTKHLETKFGGPGNQKVRSYDQSEAHPTWDLHAEPNYIFGSRRTQSRDVELGAGLPYETDAAAVPASTKQWYAIRSPSPTESEVVFDEKFFDGEHNRLLNSACFIEDMTDDEREQHWMVLGREKGRHSGKEWKLYYEKIVRPAYLAKTQKTEVIPSNVTTNAMHDGSSLADDGARKESAEPHIRTANTDSSKVGDSEPVLCDGSAKKDNWKVGSRNFKTSNEGMEAPEVHDRDITEALPFRRHTKEPVEAYLGSSIVQKTTNGSGDAHKNQLLSVATPSKVGTDVNMTTTTTPAFSDLNTTEYTPNTDSTSCMGSPPSASQTTTPLRRRPPFSNFPTESSQIFYHPDTRDTSHLRTILISNIGFDVTLAEVVSKIRGGKIVRARFFETNGMKTIPPMTTNTATVEFLTADDATVALNIWIEEQRVTLNSQVHVRTLEATLLCTPTRPLRPQLEYDMTNRDLTRTFYIVDEQQKWTPDVVMQQMMLRNPHLKRPLVAAHLGNNKLFFEFADVRDAATAWEVVERDQWMFRGVKKGFLPDPCSAHDGQVRGEKEATSGSDADDEGDGGSTAVNTPEQSFEAAVADDMTESHGAM